MPLWDNRKKMTPAVNELRRSSTNLIVGSLAALYCVVVVVVVVGGLWSIRQQSQSVARDQAQAIAVFSAAYTSRMYDVADQVATQLADELSGPAPLTLDRLGSRLANASARTGLNDYIVVVDRQGHVVAASEPMMMRPARRDAYAAHNQGADLFIGPVIRSRLTGDVIYRLSRRIEDDQGGFKGYVSVAIRPLGVRPTTERAAPQPQVTVWSDDGRFIAATFVDFTPTGDAVAPSAPAGSKQSMPGRVRVQDGLILSSAPVEGLPLRVLVEFDQDGVLAPYRRIAPIVLLIGGLLLLIGVGLAAAGVVGARREARSRQALEIAKSAAEAAARERETLLKEIHHRVRNSLMLVSSFLHLQGRDADSATREAMERVQARVTSIGVVHETLYAGSHLARVDLDEYLSRLLPELGAGLGVADRRIALSCHVKDIAVASDQATTIGLIVSEAVTNAVKHAFDDDGGEVRVEADRVGPDRVALTISDNGKGVDPLSAQGQGSRLLESLARQLRGRSAITSARGTSVRIVFPSEN